MPLVLILALILVVAALLAPDSRLRLLFGIAAVVAVVFALL